MSRAEDSVAKAAHVPILIPALLIAASSVSILSTDLYTPSMPHLQGVFGTDAGSVQLTMSLNLAGFALAQLFYGPLSDRVGRRRVLLGGMIGFALASLACAMATTIDALIVARIVQGMTACAEAVVGYAVIRELYDEAGAVRIFGAYGMAIALAPALGPVIGGQMHVWLGWRSNFFLLTALIVVVAYLIWRHLPETLRRPDPDALKPANLLSGYRALLGDGPFMTYALLTGIVLAGLFASVTAFPFLFIESMGVRTDHYGYYYGAIVLAYFFGSMAVNRAAGHWSSDRLLAVGLAFCAAGGLALPLVVVGGFETPAWVTASQCLFTFGLGLVLATAPVRAFDVCRAGHGYAAALLGALEMGGGGIGAFLVGLLHDGSARPIAVVLGGASLLAAVLYLTARPWRVRPAGP
ncbi:MAG: multidrug effflux MFS transporter [Alphaproteobacteria bacterium]|nr:multidrug effflux MFS transporter [Alphaproteobacteria bacterium]